MGRPLLSAKGQLEEAVRGSEVERQMAFMLGATQLPRPERQFRFDPHRRWAFDFAWPRHLVALECDGGIWQYGRHNRPQGYENDCEKLNTAALLGWRVLRVTTKQVESGQALVWVEQALSRHAGSP